MNHCGCPNLEQLHSKGTQNCYFFIILGISSHFIVVMRVASGQWVYLLTEWNRTRSLDHRGKGYPSVSLNVYCSDLDLVVYIAIMS